MPPAAPLAQTSSTVFVDATTVDLCGEDLCVDFLPEWTTDGLVEVDPDGDAARVMTGQEIGHIHVTAQLWDGRPSLPDDLDTWQDVSEVSAVWRSAFIDFGTTADEEDDAQRLSLLGPADYRLRVHGRHRDDGDPRDEDQPVEEYLIQVWPEPQATAHIIKSTSRTAAMWRAD